MTAGHWAAAFYGFLIGMFVHVMAVWSFASDCFVR